MPPLFPFMERIFSFNDHSPQSGARGFAAQKTGDGIDRRTDDRHRPGMTQDTPIFFSPKAAAAHVGCGRTTIMRALSTNELNAIRDNKNAWRISKADLDEWAGQRPVTDPPPPSPAHEQLVGTPTDTPETLARLAVAEARLADALAERDRWRALAERLSEPRPSIWTRIFNRD